MLSLLHGSQLFDCQSSLLLPVSYQVAASGKHAECVLIGTHWKESGDINDKSPLPPCTREMTYGTVNALGS